MMLKKRGWVLSDNVMISIHGVKKIGGGKNRDTMTISPTKPPPATPDMAIPENMAIIKAVT